MVEKKGDPSWIRLKPSTKHRVAELSQSLGNISESEIMEWLIRLGLDLYDFHRNHFTVLPLGLNFTAMQNGKED